MTFNKNIIRKKTGKCFVLKKEREKVPHHARDDALYAAHRDFVNLGSGVKELA
jgi:hypothetical protein